MCSCRVSTCSASRLPIGCDPSARLQRSREHADTRRSVDVTTPKYWHAIVPVMPITIELANFADPALARFLQAHLEDLEPTAPPESRHALDLRSLQAPGVRLWVARDRGIVGTGALSEIESGHEEIKSMRTDPMHRGRGIARKLLLFMLDDAYDRGVHQCRWRRATWTSSLLRGRSRQGRLRSMSDRSGPMWTIPTARS